MGLLEFFRRKKNKTVLIDNKQYVKLISPLLSIKNTLDEGKVKVKLDNYEELIKEAEVASNKWLLAYYHPFPFLSEKEMSLEVTERSHRRDALCINQPMVFRPN